MQYNALQTIQAFEAGQGQRKEREREAAMKQFGNALANNDYGGAAKLGFQISPELGMQAQQYGDSRNALATRRTIGKQLGAGDYKGGMSTAFAEGELDMGTQIQSMMQNMEQGDREKFAYSIQETAAVAGSLLSYATPEERKQALMSDPQLQKRLEMAGIPLDQALNAPMDNASLEGQMKMGFTAGQIMEMRRADAAAETDQERFDLGYGLDLRRVQLAEKEAARSTEAANAYGLTPVYGRDANGNRVILQTSKDGTVARAAIPEGVTLEDDYSRAFDRTSGTEAAKKAAYESTAGQALTAFEAKTDELLLQIDDAVEKTNKGNTGFIGQFIAAGDLDGVLSSIGAKAMLSELVAIKAQGGTLGALSDSEGKALRDAAVNVARSQSEEQLDRNLKAYRLQVENSRMRLKQAFEDEYINRAAPARGGAATPANRAVGPSGQPVPEGFE